MKKNTILLALLLVLSLVPASSLMAAVPSVNIGGVSGGASWLWLEAENSSSTTGHMVTAWTYAISGYRDDSALPLLNNMVRDDGSGSPTVAWQAHIPAAMSAKTKMLAYCGSNYGRTATASVDGVQTGTFGPLPVGAYGAVTGWASTSIGAISAGNHDVQMQVPIYDGTGWDGVLLYDGDIDSSGHPNIQPEQFSGITSYWMGANMVPSDRPAISASSVTPSFSVTDAVGAKYYVSFNGTVSTYVPGTAITQPGIYRVWVEAWGSTAAGDATPQERTLAGVDFVLASGTLLPAVQISGLSGAANWLWVEAEDANYMTPGTGPGSQYASYLSGFKGDSPYVNNVVSQAGGASDNQWVVSIPAAMTNPKLLVQAASHYARSASILVDGAAAGSYPSLPQGDYGIIGTNDWGIASLSSGISSGTHVMELNDGIYDSVRWDGWLLYDGDIASAGHPTTTPITYGYEYTINWMDANMQPNSWPTINASSVTPTFSVTGIGNGGVNYYVNLDGAVSTYVPGTALTQPGKYRVWAEAWASTASALVDFPVPQKRIMAGADFILYNSNRPQPSVEVQGLDGAAPWLWIEAEDADTIQNGYVNIKSIAGYSGLKSSTPTPYDQVFLSGDSGIPVIQWTFFLPAAVNGGFTVLPHCGQHYVDIPGRGLEMYLDGADMGLVQCPQSDWGDNPLWTAWPVSSSVTASTHKLRLQGNVDNAFGFDGILIYGGTITAAQNPSVVAYPSDMTWMDANMTNTNFPVIPASSVTPTFVVSGTDQGGVNYWISKNGAAKTAYVLGTAITAAGSYRVWAEAWAQQWSSVPAIAQKRILGGADFQLQAPQVASLKAAKTAGDGETVSIASAVVSASFNGYFYIQDGDTGIRVDKNGSSIALPSRVTVSGTVQTNSDGERYIDATIVSPITSTDTVSPLGLANKALGGGSFSYSSFPVQSGQVGVQGGTGLNNVGLLVKVWGVATKTDANNFTISDGSGVVVNVLSPLGGAPSTGQYVSVTGASSTVMVNGQVQRLVRVDNPNEISTH